MIPHNSPCECGTVDSERVWVSCLWCTEPHHGGRPRGQARWCRCQCHWLMTLPEAIGRDATGICWGCMAEFCSGAYSDVYRLDRIYWLLDKTTTVMRRHIDRATEFGATVEVHRPTHTWGDEDPGIGSSSVSTTMSTRENQDIQVHITEWWRRVHAIRALDRARHPQATLEAGAADHRWIEWSVRPPDTDAQGIIRRGFRSHPIAWDWDNPDRYFELNRGEDLIPSPASQTPDSSADGDFLADEAIQPEEAD